MQKVDYIIIPNKKSLKEFEEKRINTFALPLKDFSISYDAYFTVNDINRIAKKHVVFVIINKFLHRKIDSFRKIYDSFDKGVSFIVEDIGLLDVIDKNRLILNENHIESNYMAINFLAKQGVKNIVLNNDLTKDEVLEIRKKTKSKLFFYLIDRNILMYSRRKLVSNYNKYFKKNTDVKSYHITESVSSSEMEIIEEGECSTIRNRKIFSANKYLNELSVLDYLIVDTTLMSNLELRMVLNYYNSTKLSEILDTDSYFLDNEIKYKVGDIK